MSFSCKVLFVDVGGVLLTNGWDHHMREDAAQRFGLDLVEMNQRHALTFDTYEIGKISLDVYLQRVVFYQPRSFTPDQFKQFMFSQSKALPGMIEMIREFKEQCSLSVVALSNEGAELMLHRIKTFKMNEFIDFFICSCFTGYRKPDLEIYQLALNMVQVLPEEVIYIDDRKMLTEIGSQLGMRVIHHKTLEETKKKLSEIKG